MSKFSFVFILLSHPATATISYYAALEISNQLSRQSENSRISQREIFWLTHTVIQSWLSSHTTSK